MDHGPSQRRPYVGPTEGRRPPRYTLSLAFFVLLAAGLALWSGRELALTSEYGSLLDIADRLDLRQPVAPAAFAAQLDRADRLVTETVCRSDLLKAGMDVLLVALDGVDPAADFDGWAATIGRADRFASHAIRCVPTGAAFWTRQATLRQAIAEQSGPLSDMVRLSSQLAPADYSLLMARLAMAARMGEATRALLAPVIAKDAEILLSYAWIAPFAKDVARLMPQRKVKDILAPAFRDIAPQRHRQFLARGFDPLQQDRVEPSSLPGTSRPN